MSNVSLPSFLNLPPGNADPCLVKLRFGMAWHDAKASDSKRALTIGGKAGKELFMISFKASWGSRATRAGGKCLTAEEKRISRLPAWQVSFGGVISRIFGRLP